MGLAGLFEITAASQQQGLWTFDIRIDPSHEVFSGHFPGMPVMPGVCSMYIIRQCVSQACGRKLSYDTIRECKFVSSVLPAEHTMLTVELSISETESGINVSGNMSSGQETMVKIKANLI